jgi:hypothetical protein
MLSHQESDCKNSLIKEGKIPLLRCPDPTHTPFKFGAYSGKGCQECRKAPPQAIAASAKITNSDGGRMDVDPLDTDNGERQDGGGEGGVRRGTR